MEVNKILQGDSLEVLKTFESESVDCIITSPPYFGLRNYGEAGQIGLEPTFTEYLEKILKITEELKRVLKPSGSFWLNMGDSFNCNKIGKTDKKVSAHVKDSQIGMVKKLQSEIPEKSLIGQPWRMALALIDQQGWILRADVNWIKQILIWKDNNKYTMGSVMPTSVKDRFNMASEHLFHFVKNQKYYFDMDAIRIPNQVLGVTDMRASGFARSAELYYDSKYREEYRPMPKQSNARPKYSENPEEQNIPHARKLRPLKDRLNNSHQQDTKSSRAKNVKKTLSEVRLGIKPKTEGMKNLPNNWLIRYEPLAESHFASYPTALCDIPILATCPPNGLVLDPFFGSGSTGVAARRIGRNYLGIELSEKYIAIAEKRLRQEILC